MPPYRATAALYVGNGSGVCYIFGTERFRCSIVQFRSQEGLHHDTKIGTWCPDGNNAKQQYDFLLKTTIGFECQILIAADGWNAGRADLDLINRANACIRADDLPSEIDPGVRPVDS